MHPHVVTGHVLHVWPHFSPRHLDREISGSRKFFGIGIVILRGRYWSPLQGVDLNNFYIALILLGIALDFGFIRARHPLFGPVAHEPHERGRLQG